MKKFFILTFICAIIPFCSCTNNSSQSTSDKVEQISDYTEELNSTFNNTQSEAIISANSIVRNLFDSNAEFLSEGTIVNDTEVPNRYEILQKFISPNNNNKEYIYRIWVQKFSDKWEYGTLEIENDNGVNVFSSCGDMKNLEQAEINSIKPRETTNVKYSIIKSNKPNYAVVYTSKKLNRDDVLAVYNDLKDEFEQIQFTISRNPNDNEYINIQGSTIFLFDTGDIKPISEY